MLKLVLDKIWNEHGVTDALRKNRWELFTGYAKAVQAHYRPKSIRPMKKRVKVSERETNDTRTRDCRRGGFPASE